MKINNNIYYETGNKKKYMIFTFGCQMNEHDTEVLSGLLEEMGYEHTNSIKESDIIIFNTCSVREHAENRVLGRISQLKPLKNIKPDLILGICGCMMQEKNMSEYVLEHFPYVDLIFGTHNIHELPVLIKKAMESNSVIYDVWENNQDIVENLPMTRKDKIKAYVNIMYGCNNFCTYCIVPYVRGRERSRKPEDIINEVKVLADEGYKEITLLGQNVNSYGRGLEKKIDFADLLYMINEMNGIERIRFTTSHPKDLSDKLIYAMRDCEKVCEHIHLPVQAGSDRILKLMNRHYTKESYLLLVDKLRQNIPDIAITTDIIVGFPSETDEDFIETLDLVKKAEFDLAYTFIYSKRTGTIAAQMDNQVQDEIKHKRLDELIKLQNSISLEKNSRLKDVVVEVLVEEVSKRDINKLSGRTRTNKLVHFPGDDSLIGCLANVKITEPRAYTLIGEILE
ncbi:MAG: tRNA (N6-isopentenyl adenosine(37)-C2)-methylthiotransferase MiaB [Thermoanaerobacteraceae bacterium]|nr:tRNA (N6-isopentenyl adenosine(37)-C2)-methylthiotransferase MiaB [Thermoanaerobacteraceae bacterium]